MARVRTSFIFGQERVIVIGNADKDELAEQMKVFTKVSERAGKRPGEQISGGDLAVSSDTLACMNALSPDGGLPLSPDPSKVKIIRFPKGLVYSSEW